MTAHQRDSEAINVNHPDLVHWVYCKIFKLLYLARGLLKILDAKNRHFGTIAQLCQAVSSQLRHVSTIGKKLVKHRYVLHMSS